jgi:hypothetical protein
MRAPGERLTLCQIATEEVPVGTLAHLRIVDQQLCEPLDDVVWYDMTNGVRVRLSDPLLLDDGAVQLNASFPLRGNALLDNVETMLRCRFHGRGKKTYFRLAEPKTHIISAEDFVEAMLGSAQRINAALRGLSEPMTGVLWTMRDAENLLEIIDAVRDGRMDHTAFSARMAQADYSAGTHGHHQLFSRNAHIMVEHTRTALLRAFENGNRMMEQTRLLIENKDNRYFGALNEGDEINHASPAAERLHGAIIDGVAAVATALDLLYRLFVFLVREPFGSAEMPGKLHFPYNELGKAYTNPHKLEPMCPVAHSKRDDAPGLVDEGVPGIAAVIKDIFVGRKDTVGEPVIAHELPDVFLRVEFRAFGWQRHDGDVGRDV